jgi:hypothetical protein
MPIVFYRNIGLSDARTGGQTSTVGEPNVANRGGRIFFTGNWYATKSLDRGNTWDDISPFTTLPRVNGGFCCDQTLIYERSRDILVWILQYSRSNRTNTLRVAINPKASLDNNDWHWWDFRPASVNADWDGEWFDYNHAATSDNFLYVGTNMFTVDTERFTRSVIFRFPLDSLASASSLNHSYYSTENNFSLRCVQGARDVMHFGSHNNNSQIRVFSWPENANSVSFEDVNVTRWVRDQPYSAPGPDGNNWLRRCGPRITGGAVADGVITFAWTANASGGRPQPHVRVVRLDESSKNLINEPDIWNENYAFAYPSICPNGRGVIGITLFRGGGNIHPGHVVGARDETRGTWSLRATRNGTNGPNDDKWGDYLGIVPYSGGGFSWFASGYTLQGGGGRLDVEPQVVQFGYRSS